MHLRQEQKLVYDKAKTEDLVVNNVNYDGTKLKFIYIGSNFVDAKDLVLGIDTKLPKALLTSLNLFLLLYF